MKKQRPVRALFISNLAGPDLKIKDRGTQQVSRGHKLQGWLAILILYREDLIHEHKEIRNHSATAVVLYPLLCFFKLLLFLNFRLSCSWSLSHQLQVKRQSNKKRIALITQEYMEEPLVLTDPLVHLQIKETNKANPNNNPNAQELLHLGFTSREILFMQN